MYVIDLQLDFWHEARMVGGTSEVMVPPEKIAMVREYLMKGGLDIHITHENVERQVGFCIIF